MSVLIGYNIILPRSSISYFQRVLDTSRHCTRYNTLQCLFQAGTILFHGRTKLGAKLGNTVYFEYRRRERHFWGKSNLGKTLKSLLRTQQCLQNICYASQTSLSSVKTFIISTKAAYVRLPTKRNIDSQVRDKIQSKCLVLESLLLLFKIRRMQSSQQVYRQPTGYFFVAVFLLIAAYTTLLMSSSAEYLSQWLPQLHFSFNTWVKLASISALTPASSLLQRRRSIPSVQQWL